MSRQATDGGSVLSFTFLDVLMCTMGSLLLLLVVFGVIAKKATRVRREGEDARISLTALAAPTSAPAPPPAGDPAEDAKPDAAELAKQLEKVRTEQAQLERLRTEAAERRSQEQARITHLEDHERRLEHELGKLHVTLQALEAAEQKQNVDQEQAEAEAKKLKELIDETEKRLDEMRKNAGDKSYAIVPYKGANGTLRRPVFIECTADAVTIQPEGIRLTVEDFDGPLRSGNPLAAAVRAAHEELNGRAAAAGQTDLPDPYPLLIVRPDGAAAYAAALDAIRSWDSDYGYEFVEADWKLKFPEPDPRLSQVMAHAVDEARQRQALLARVAPRRYASRLSAGGAAMGGGGSGEGGGSGVGLGGGFESLGGGAGDRIGDHAGDGALSGGAGGNPLRSGGGGNGAGGAGGNFMDEFDEAGAVGGGAAGTLVTNGGGNGPGGVGGPGSGPGAGQYAGGEMAGSPGMNGAIGGGRYGGTGGAGTTPPYGAPPQGDGDGSGAAGAGATQIAGQPGGAAGAGGTEGASGAAGSTGGGAGQSQGASGGGASGGDGGSSSTAGGGASSGGGGAAGASGSSNAMAAGAQGIPPMQMNQSNRRRGSSAADKRGVNWANAEASRNAAAITRPIKVQVNQDQILVFDADGRPADSGAISFKQPVDRVMDRLAGAVQRQVADWGLAGDGMYWRPTLVVSVAPGAERQAQRVSELLENSGVDVRLPQATASAAGGSGGPR